MSHWPILQQIASMRDNDMKILNYLYFMSSNRGCRYAVNYTHLSKDLKLSKVTIFRAIRFLKDHCAIREVLPTEKEAATIKWQDYHWFEIADLSRMPDLFQDKKYSELHSHNYLIAQFIEQEGGFWETLQKWNFGKQNMHNDHNQETRAVDSFKNETQKEETDCISCDTGTSISCDTPTLDFTKSAYNQNKNETTVSAVIRQPYHRRYAKTPFSHSLEQKEKTEKRVRNCVSPSLEKNKKQIPSREEFCCEAEERSIGNSDVLGIDNGKEQPRIIFVNNVKIIVVENIYQIQNSDINNIHKDDIDKDKDNTISDDMCNAYDNAIEEEKKIPRAREEISISNESKAVENKNCGYESIVESEIGFVEMGFLTATEALERNEDSNSSSEERGLLEMARNDFYDKTGTGTEFDVGSSIRDSRKEVSAMRNNDNDKKLRREEVRQMALRDIEKASAVPEPDKIKFMQDEKRVKAERVHKRGNEAGSPEPKAYEIYSFIAQEANERGKRIPALTTVEGKRLKNFVKKCKQNGIDWQDCLKEIFLIIQKKKKIFAINEILTSWNFDEAFDTLVNKKQKKIEQQEKINSKNDIESFELILAE